MQVCSAQSTAKAATGLIMRSTIPAAAAWLCTTENMVLTSRLRLLMKQSFSDSACGRHSAEQVAGNFGIPSTQNTVEQLAAMWSSAMRQGLTHGLGLVPYLTWQSPLRKIEALAQRASQLLPYEVS